MTKEKVYCEECEYIEEGRLISKRMDLAKCQLPFEPKQYISRKPLIDSCGEYCDNKNHNGECKDYIKKIVTPKQSLFERFFKWFKNEWGA